jgi:tRNA A-37 threonylcarbamoyl transferase component Bud32
MPSEIRTGTVLAGFEVETLVGEGAMGSVYLARAREGRAVALKVLTPALARDERFRQRFLRESQVAAGLEHPHIVPTIASGEKGGTLFLAMAYVDGTDLNEVLRQEGRLEPQRAIDLIDQVAGALDAAHAEGLVHRDVKPGNILVAAGPSGEHAYICDFGIARHISSVSSLTGERGFVGTIDYVSPEQIEGGPIDGRADVYSLACVLYECLAGARPFDRDSELSVVFAHLNEPPPRLTDLRREFPQAFDVVFTTALAKSPADRYSNCGELSAAARLALSGKVATRRVTRRRQLLIAGGTLLAAVGGAITGVLALQSHTSRSISETAIDGVRLGLSDRGYQRLWGPGSIRPLKYPRDYARREFQGRKVAVYFASGDVQGAIQHGIARAVEITTWNRVDRTREGVGPCSTVAALKQAYGTRLKPVKANIIEGKVYGYTVGRKLFFAVGPPPNPTGVQAVALYSNALQFAGFNALGDYGPCT